MIAGMKRRAFITLLGGAAAAWPLAVGVVLSENSIRLGIRIVVFLTMFNSALSPWAESPDSPASIAPRSCP